MASKTKQKSVLSILDFTRSHSRKAPEHPLVTASAAMHENATQRKRTGSLVGLLIAQAARARRRSQPHVRVRVQAFTPSGSRAARIRLPV